MFCFLVFSVIFSLLFVSPPVFESLSQTITTVSVFGLDRFVLTGGRHNHDDGLVVDHRQSSPVRQSSINFNRSEMYFSRSVPTSVNASSARSVSHSLSMEVKSLLPVNQCSSSDLFLTSSPSKLYGFYSKRRFYYFTRIMDFVKSKILVSSLSNQSEFPVMLLAKSMVEPFVSESCSDSSFIGGSLFLNSSNRWFLKLYPTDVRSPSLPLWSSSASVSSLGVSTGGFMKLIRLVRVSTVLSRASLLPSAENETQQYQTPSLTFIRRSSLWSDPIGDGEGSISENPSNLTFLMGHLGPLVFGFWISLKIAWVMELGLFWVYLVSSYWLVLLESVVMSSGWFVFCASLIYLMHLHCSSLTSIVSTSLPFIRFTVRDSLITTPPIRRVTFPDRCFTDQRLHSLSENFQTAYKRALSGLLKVVLSWSTSEKCAIFSIKHLDPIEGSCVHDDRHHLSMRFGVLSIYFLYIIASRLDFNSFRLWPEDTIKQNVVFVID